MYVFIEIIRLIALHVYQKKSIMKTGNHVLETVDLLNPTDFRKCEIDIVISIIPITFISAYII